MTSRRWACAALSAVAAALPVLAGTAAAQQPTGTITIVKEAIPPRYQDFRFTTGNFGPDVPRSFTLDDDDHSPTPNSTTFSGLAPGTYVITEVRASGWELADIRCTPVEAARRSAQTVTITITDIGESVTCTFVNEKVVGGPVEVSPIEWPTTTTGEENKTPAPAVDSSSANPLQDAVTNAQGEAVPATETTDVVEAAKALKELPRTGPSAAAAGALGAALFAGGALVLGAARRRARRAGSAV